MQRPHPGSDRSNRDHLGEEDAEVRAAVRFAVVVAVVGVAFLVVAALLIGTCDGGLDVDSVVCGAPQRIVLAFGAPVILLIGGLWAFVRTFRVWRNFGTWWGWQGAGWFLFLLMLLTLTMGVPPMAGPVLGG